jgi:Calcineurin-like phosphoesterase
MASDPSGNVSLVMLEVVIGDVHARAEALRELLEAVGVLDARGRRRERAWVVQVGDLLDRHADPEANLATAKLAAASVDLVLAGNHEARLMQSAAPEQHAAIATLATRGWPHAAAAAGDWLITHAGIHPQLAATLPARADECAAEIDDRWHCRRQGDPLFDWIGPSREGAAPFGGIYWLGANEWPVNGGETPWPQISGHVPQRMPRQLTPRRWAIDVGGRGGRLAALVRPHPEARWRPVVVGASSGHGERSFAAA